MKKALLIFICLTAVQLSAQTMVGAFIGLCNSDIYIKGYGNGDLLWKSGLSAGIQAEFFRKSNLTLVTELSYLQKGAKEKWEITTEQNPEGTRQMRTVYFHDDYLSLSALAKYRLPIKRWAPFIIAGPRMDQFITRQRSTYYQFVTDQKRNNTIIGLTAGLGVEYAFEKWMLFLRTSFQYDITNSLEQFNVPSESLSLHNRAILLDIGAAIQL